MSKELERYNEEGLINLAVAVVEKCWDDLIGVDPEPKNYYNTKDRSTARRYLQNLGLTDEEIDEKIRIRNREEELRLEELKKRKELKEAKKALKAAAQ